MAMDILRAIGGLGAFLLGLNLLVEGLKGLAGPALRDSLARFTKSPLSGAVTGAAATALVQSSSVVTVTAIGFVSASLMTFPQALGVIFGANVGTTATGWIISLIGFKLDLAGMLGPAIFAGVMLRLFGRGKLRHAGWAIAGFGLVFTGLAIMQSVMAVFADYVSPASFPPDTILGRLQLVGIGVAMAVVLQSSSAGVATALVAIGAGAISLPQAAALVIGLDIGTTVTALLATIGGAAGTRRTGLAHLVFNLFTGALAFAILPLWIALTGRWFDPGDAHQAQVALVSFHTTFNVLGATFGVLLARPFARLLMRLVPDEYPTGAQQFDRQLLAEPLAAIEPLAAAVRDLASRTLDALEASLESGRAPLDAAKLDAITHEHDAMETVLALLRTSPEQEGLHQRHVAMLHVLDHTGRMLARLGSADITSCLRGEDAMRPFTGPLALQARKAADACTTRIWEDSLEHSAEALYKSFDNEYRTWRLRMLGEASEGREDVRQALDRLDALRWASRVSYHIWRMLHHLELAGAFETRAGRGPAG